jgi:hypothetical protein
MALRLGSLHGQELRRFRCKGGDHALAPDGKTLATGTQSPTSVIHLYDIATGRALHECRGHEGSVRSLVFAADGRTLVSGSEDKTVRFWGRVAGRSARLDEPGAIFAVALTPTARPWPGDGRRIARLDVATGKPLRSFDFPEVVYHFAMARTARSWPPTGATGDCAGGPDHREGDARVLGRTPRCSRQRRHPWPRFCPG